MTTRRLICKSMAKQLNDYIIKNQEDMIADWKASYIDTMLYWDRNEGRYLVINQKSIPIGFVSGKEDVDWRIVELVWNSYHIEDILNW